MPETPPENEETTEEPTEVAESAAPTPEESSAPAEPAASTPAPGEEDAAAADDSAPAPAPAPTVSKRDKRAAARHAEASKRPARTPEERQAERDATRKAKAVARRRRRLQEREKARANRTETPPTPERERAPGRPKVRQGVVVSDKADKTITVRIDTARRHRRYEKIVRSSSTLHAHDENNDANAGDTVRVIESRPLSRTKRWRLDEVLERAK
jgi:small subunit ribosomal protein S17